jgi:hypothetical protein
MKKLTIRFLGDGTVSAVVISKTSAIKPTSKRCRHLETGSTLALNRRKSLKTVHNEDIREELRITAINKNNKYKLLKN